MLAVVGGAVYASVRDRIVPASVIEDDELADEALDASRRAPAS